MVCLNLSLFVSIQTEHYKCSILSGCYQCHYHHLIKHSLFITGMNNYEIYKQSISTCIVDSEPSSDIHSM